MPHTTVRRRFLCCSFLLAACSATEDRKSDLEGGGAVTMGLGVMLAPGAVTYAGSAAFCSRPATMQLNRVRAATAEAQEIRRDGVTEGSARWSLLQTAMHERLLQAAGKVARQGGHDLVVRQGDIADPRGLVVADVTAAVIAAL